jgi:methionyl-tRNA synthetase
MLMSAGLPLPRCVFAHGWWTINGQKMSKSLRNVVEPNMVAADIGRDALRYFLIRETPLGNDGDFSHDGLFLRINSELANDLGNLLNRSLAMARKYCGGAVPQLADDLEADPVDRDFISLARRARDEAAAHFDAIAPSKALESVWELVRGANKYIDTTAPYKLIKDPAARRRVDEVVGNFLEALHWISLLVSPVMPDKAAEIRGQLGLGSADATGQLEQWPESWGELPTGLELSPGAPLFPRIDEEAQADLLARWQRASHTTEEKSMEKEETPEPQGKQDTPDIVSFDEFMRLDLRVAKIADATRVEGTDRLLKLSVDIGGEQRQVVAGIADSFAPEEVVGRTVIFVANLKPAKIRGVKSEGMVLAAGDKKVLALSTVDADVAPGTKIR